MISALLLAATLVLQNGDFDPVAPDTPIETLRVQAEAGDPESQYEYGYRMWENWTAAGERDPQERLHDPVSLEARRWIERASQAGWANATAFLGTLTEHGFGVPADSEIAMELYRQAADSGSPSGAFNYAWRRQFDIDARGVPDAVHYFTLAAEQDIDANLADYAGGYIAFLAMRGAEVSLDHGEIGQALEAGHAAAPDDAWINFAMGTYLTAGSEPDVQRAISHFTRSAEAGSGPAAHELGLIYLEGNGVPVDEVEAFRWIRLGAEQGYGPSVYEAATMLARGTGTEADIAAAQQLFAVSARSGNADAIRSLGAIAFSGYVGEPDQVYGAALVGIARDAGDPLAAQFFETYADEIAALDPSEIAAARERWLAENDLDVGD